MNLGSLKRYSQLESKIYKIKYGTTGNKYSVKFKANLVKYRAIKT